MKLTRLCWGLLALLAGPAAAAEAVVVEASGIALAPGTSLDGAAPLTLAVGQSVTLVTADGRTIKLSGPFGGPPVPGGEPAPGSVSASLTGLFASRAADTSSVGALRGRDRQPPVPEPWVVDVDHGGDRCIAEDIPVVFWRRKTLAADGVMTVSPADRSWSARAVWPAGTSRLGMPPALALTSSHAYAVQLDGAEVAITIHRIPRTVRTDAARAAWMLTVGCEAQAWALVPAQGAVKRRRT